MTKSQYKYLVAKDKTAPIDTYVYVDRSWAFRTNRKAMPFMST